MKSLGFTTRSTFYTNYQSLGSLQPPSYGTWLVSSAASVYAGAGGSGFRISMSHSTNFWGGLGSGGLAAGMAGGLQRIGGIQNEKETMQSLNDCLASYLHRVRSRETENQKLENKIWEPMEKKGPQVRDWGHYFKTIEDLRAQIFANTVDNACIVLQINNARLAADDFTVKYETGLAMRQSVESDIHGLRKVINDTNVTRLQLETEIEAFKEELLFMKKNHKEEVKGLQAQIASSRLTVEVDAPKSQNLAKIMADIQAQYKELARKNQEELDKHTIQSLEIDLDSMRDLKASLENSLREVETRAEGQLQAQEYQALLNIKVKQEAEITTYHCLLEDGEEFSLGDALDSRNSMQTTQRPPPTREWMAKWCLRPMTPKF
uniref:IF rod domain-containing protein n=1 Tax=Nomascus leucogenys TaxID=61853 RepID=A0A2I3HVJ0_NOMLE